MNRRVRIKDIAVIAAFTAIIAVFSQIAFPTPIGVSITLQTLAIAVTAFLTGPLRAFLSAICYVIIGTLGLPVFTGFSGGIGVLTGPTGGFIFAFPIFAVILGFVLYVNLSATRILLCAAALCILYLLGAAQFVFVTGNPLKVAVSAFLIYFTKDGLTLLAAYFLCVRIRPTLSRFIHLK